jgi:flagellar biosynthesis/type III secretory pathway chaperone
MRKKLHSLQQLLEAEVENYTLLKALEGQKRELLIAGEVENLLLLSQEQEILSFDLRELEKRRKVTQSACAEEFALDKLSTLGDLLPHLPAPEGQEIFELRQKLLDLVKEIDRLNSNNGYLIRQNISHVRELFDIVSGKSIKLSYGAQGQNANLGQRIILDQSA